MKLFTKEINEKLISQYPMGDDLENQMVVAKIFNPYGKGVWYLLNSDPEDQDYLWAIVDLFDVELGSASRSELESLKVPPFNLGLERDLYFTPINAKTLYDKLQNGEMYADGGEMESQYFEKTLTRPEFVQELFLRIVRQDKDGNPRDEQGEIFWRNRLMKFLTSDNYMFNPLDFLYRAYLSGLYHLEDLNGRTLDTTEEVLGEVSSYYEGSGQGFGSSDFTYLLQNFLSSQGIKTDFVDHRLERFDEQGNVVARSQRNRKFDDGGEIDTYDYAKMMGKESQDWDSEAREYVGEEWDNLSKKEKEEIINEMQKGWERNTHFAKGGHMEGEWVVYDPNSDKIHSTHKTHRSAKLAMDKMMNSGENESVGRMSKGEWDKYHTKMDRGGLTKSETLKVAEKYAKAISKSDNKEVSVNTRTIEEDSFDLDMDGIEFDGGSYAIYSNGDVKNHAISGNPIYGKKDSTIDEIVENLSKMVSGGQVEKVYELILRNPNGGMTERVLLSAKSKDDASNKALNLKEYSNYGYVVENVDELKYANGGETGTEILTSKGGDAWLFPSQLDKSSYGIKLANGGMTAGRWYKDNQGVEYRYIGEDMNGNQLFSDGERTFSKSQSDFEDEPKERKLFGFFNKGGQVAEKWIDSVRKMRNEVAQIVLKDGTKITGKKLHEIMKKGGEIKKVEKKPRVKRISPTLEKLKKGGMLKKKSTFDEKVKAISSKIEGTKVKSKYKKEYGARYDRKEAKEAAQKIAGSIRKKYGK